LDIRSGFTATVYTEQASPAAAWRFFGLRRDQYLRGASSAEPVRPPNKYAQPHNRVREYFCDSVGEHVPRYREPVLAIFCSWREEGGRGRVVTLTAGGGGSAGQLKSQQQTLADGSTVRVNCYRKQTLLTRSEMVDQFMTSPLYREMSDMGIPISRAK
jgi:hypothetical protein